MYLWSFRTINCTHPYARKGSDTDRETAENKHRNPYLQCFRARGSQPIKANESARYWRKVKPCEAWERTRARATSSNINVDPSYKHDALPLYAWDFRALVRTGPCARGLRDGAAMLFEKSLFVRSGLVIPGVTVSMCKYQRGAYAVYSVHGRELANDPSVSSSITCQNLPVRGQEPAAKLRLQRQVLRDPASYIPH